MRAFTHENVVSAIVVEAIKSNEKLTESYLVGKDLEGSEVKVGPIFRSSLRDPEGEQPYRNDWMPILLQLKDPGKNIPESYSGLLSYVEKAAKGKTLLYLAYTNANGFSTRCWAPSRFNYILSMLEEMEEESEYTLPTKRTTTKKKDTANKA